MANPFPPPGDAASPPRTGILVLGPPGSDRGLLLQALGLAGAALPPGFEEETEWAPARALGDRLLVAAGTGAQGWAPLGAEWLAGMEAAGLLEDAPALLASTFGPAALLAIAEPHGGRLAAIWVPALRRAGRQPMAAIVLETPAEAALRAGEGGVPEEAHLIWMRRALDAEAATRGIPRAVTTTERLRRDGLGETARVLARLGLDAPLPVRGAVPGTLPNGPGESRPGGARPPAAALEALAILSAWSQGSEEEGHARLDALRAELDAAARLAGPVVARLRQRDGDLARQIGEIARLTQLLLRAEASGPRLGERLRSLREGAREGGGPLGRLAALARGVAAGGLAERRRVRRRMEAVRRSGRFDAEWYLRANLDVALAGLDPLRHYVTHGEAEGRPPNGRGMPAPPPGSAG